MNASGGGEENTPRSAIVPLPELLRGHPRVALDANVLIALLEGEGPRADRAASVLDAIEAGLVEGVAAVIVLTEVLVRYARLGDVARFETVADELRGLRVDYVPVSEAIAVDAARLRSARAVTLADSIHLACARAASASALVTNDRRIRPTSHVDVLYLDDLAAEMEPSSR